MSRIEPNVAAATSPYLTFLIADGEYAIPVLEVREVVEVAPITRVPSAPFAVRGVMNLRGSVVPVLDLGVRIGLAERPITKWACVVVVLAEIGGESTAIGLLVDAVSQVIELAPGDIEPVPPFGAPVRAEFLDGIGIINSTFVLLLNVGRTLSASDLLSGMASPGPTSEVAGAFGARPSPTAAGRAS